MMKRDILLLLTILLCGTISSPAQIESVGIIGTATPFGWDADTNMVQDTADAHLWTLQIELTEGLAKFRANDDWAINWGGENFPADFGEQDGDDIVVSHAGLYNVSLNDSSGLYYFEFLGSNIGLIGEGTPFTWDRDINMLPDTSDTNKFNLTIDLGMGAVKFRQDDDWTVNWGASDFPMGIGVQEGPNVPIDQAGKYEISFDTSTGEYNFVEIIAFENVGIIGDATANGWDSVTALNQSNDDPSVWTAGVTLTDGGLQFVGNDGDIVWGANGWPTDTAVLDGDTIPAVAGDYIVSFNTETGVYEFTEVIIYESIGIIGTVLDVGFDGPDVDMERSPADSSMWTLRIELLDGEAKFRANDAWDVNWGAGDFPSGVGIQNGPNIPVTAGDYQITFNSITGDYNFQAIVEFDAISLVGKSGPFGDWPGDDASRDLFLEVDPDDPQSWSTTNVTLTDHTGADDEGVKFRADTSWTVNWGAADFPAGIGTQDGPNIVTVAGTYNVSFNSASGEYLFSDPATSTLDIVKPSQIKVFPNPAADQLTVDLSALDLTGVLTVRVYDLAGKMLMATEKPAEKQLSLNIGQLGTGQYVLQITSSELIMGKKFSVVE